MRKVYSLCTAIMSATMASAILAGSAHAAACNGLSGSYIGKGKVVAIVVGQDGSTVNVTMPDGRPNAYGFCSGNKLTVNFPDDHPINGAFNGRTIRWDNGTSWTKQ